MGVWRWECADKSELDKYKGHQVHEGVEVNVVPGTYEVKHYFDSEGRSGSAKVYRIYSEIKLKELAFLKSMKWKLNLLICISRISIK
jgi:hypothetical protein